MNERKPYSLEKIRNGDMYDYRDQDGISWENPASWLWIGILNGCGCGSSEDLAARVVQVLDIFAERGNFDYRNSFFDESANEILAHWLESVGLLEHGTIFTGSWLTDAGKQVHESIHQFDIPDEIALE